MNNTDNKNEKIITTVRIILAVIMVLAIGYGVGYHVLGLFHFGKEKETKVEITQLGKNVSDTKTFSEDITGLEVDLDISELKIKYGKELSVHYSLPEKIVPEIKVDDNKLIVKSNNKINISMFDLSNIKDIASLTNNSEAGVVEITIPEGVKLEDVSINIDLGDVELEGIKSDNLTVNADCGDIKISGISTNQIEINSDLGDVKVSDVSFDSAEVNSDMGDITVSGDFDKLSANCSMGDVEVNTDRAASEVVLDLNVDMGDIKVNGQKW